MKEITVTPGKWIEVTSEEFSLWQDPCDNSPLNSVHLTKEDVVIVFYQLREFLYDKIPNTIVRQ